MKLDINELQRAQKNYRWHNIERNAFHSRLGQHQENVITINYVFTKDFDNTHEIILNLTLGQTITVTRPRETSYSSEHGGTLCNSPVKTLHKSKEWDQISSGHRSHHISYLFIFSKTPNKVTLGPKTPKEIIISPRSISSYVSGGLGLSLKTRPDWEKRKYE